MEPSRYALSKSVTRLLILLTMVSVAMAEETSDKQDSETKSDPISIAALTAGKQTLREQEFRVRDFTFARARWTGFPKRGRSVYWATDYPDADLALSRRLDKWTTLNVGEGSAVVDVADATPTEHPILYMAEPGHLILSDAEVTALRAYLQGGGFLFADDFWGESEWASFRSQLKRVLPDSDIVDLPLEHQIFRHPFQMTSRPQVCSIAMAISRRAEGVTWERDDSRQVHYWGISADDGRLMAVLCHNTDLADGWERAEDDRWYGEEFSEKRAFPMAMNIIVHALKPADP